MWLLTKEHMAMIVVKATVKSAYKEPAYKAL